MAKIKPGVQYHQVAAGMKARGQGRDPHPTTKEIESGVQERLNDHQFGKDNGFLLELDEGEDIKNVRPKLMSVGKKLMITLGSETQADERAMWIWVVAEGRQARQPRAEDNGSEEEAPKRGEELLLDPKRLRRSLTECVLTGRDIRGLFLDSGHLRITLNQMAALHGSW